MAYIIGVAGGSGSGKTTVSRKVAEQFSGEEVVVLTHDSYYRAQPDKSLDERRLTNYDHPDSLETELMVEHLKKLQNGESVRVPIYDFVNHDRAADPVEVFPKKVIVVEGILIFENKDLREMMDLKVFVQTDDDIRFIRRLERDIKQRGRTMEQVIEQYKTSVKPMYEMFVEPAKKYADVIIPEGGLNTKAIEMLLARIREIVVN
jgi:uridine kinase